KKTTRDPLVLDQNTPEKLPLAERVIRHHFPLLEPNDVWESDEVRQHLFDVAPKSLFVFPQQDLSNASAYLDPRLGRGGAREVPFDAPVEYSKLDEALLLVSEMAELTSDGNIFR